MSMLYAIPRVVTTQQRCVPMFFNPYTSPALDTHFCPEMLNVVKGLQEEKALHVEQSVCMTRESSTWS
jgi:hypothetical protein